MAALTFLILIGVVAGIAMLVPIVVGYMNNGTRAALREARQEVLDGKARERVAMKALRSIRNDAGNPHLEASIALDEIEALETAQQYKELN